MNCHSPSHLQEQLSESAVCDAHSAATVVPMMKRLYDVLFAAGGLIVLAPLLLLIAAIIKVTDGGAVFYRQVRIGQHGQPFNICKLRTMVSKADGLGPLVTRDGDARVTWVGHILRKTKLDELPQLWNVLKGEMSLVGPRPEVPKYAGRYTPEQRSILNLKPGITDLASIHFRNEELLLKDADNVEEFYVQHCIPRKVQLNLEYARRANLLSDTWIILQTICPYWICLLSVYGLVLAASFWLSCLLVYDFTVPAWLYRDFAGATIAVMAVQLGALIWRQQCKGLLSYFSVTELRQIAAALGLACLLLLGLRALTHRAWPPSNLILVDALLSLCALSGFRLTLRFWRESASADQAGLDGPVVRVGIIGAGRTGSQLARELMARGQFGRTVVAFFDDDCQKWHKCMHEIPIVGMPECLLDGWAGKLDEVIVAIPQASAERARDIQDLLQRSGLKAYAARAAHGVWLGNGNAITGRFGL
jgi:lipopolysaccharide/colanic/teichoic acid biosynthesis glycosyltransferase